MSADIGPGDWVEVVKFRGDGWSGGASVCPIGSVWVVEARCQTCTVTGLYLDGVLLKGLGRNPNTGRRWGLSLDCVRPIHRPSQSSLIQDLLKVPARPKVSA